MGSSPAPPQLIHKTHHIQIRLHESPEFPQGAVEAEFEVDGTRHREHGPHAPSPSHPPIAVSIDDQECVLWESSVDSFRVELFNADKGPRQNPFYRDFPAVSIRGADGVHRLSTGPIRAEERGRREIVAFNIQFTGPRREAVPLDPHVMPYP